MNELPEADWRLFRRLHALALERFCERVFREIEAISSDAKRSLPDRYRAVYGLIQERDREIARAFDDPRRSRALIQLAWMCGLGVLDDEDLSGFSPAVQASLSFFWSGTR